MIATRSWKGLLLATCAALGGCAGMSEGPVPISQSTSVELEGLRTAIREECLDMSVTTGQQGNQDRRNELVTAFMAAADMNYNNYERELLAFSRDNDLGGSLANQLLSAIGAASGSRAISRATNITSGAVSGTQSAFAKSLLNQTVSVLQTHMRAQRATQAAQIIDHLALPYEQWNTCLALREALAYEQAGTLNAALAAMAASATANEEEGDADEDRAIRRIAYSRAPLSQSLRDYLYPADRSLWATRAQTALNILRANPNLLPMEGVSLEARLSHIEDDPDRDAERRALMTAILEDSTVDEELKRQLREALAR